MASEIQVQYSVTGATLYAMVRNRIGEIWNLASAAFEAYNASNIDDYDIALTEQGASGFYVGNFPTTIAAGVYSIVAKRQAGASPAQSDASVANGDLQWNGTVTLPLSDLATSGQIGQAAPLRIARGTGVPNFPFKMVSAADHVTPFVSGIISGQISRDGGAFGALQSGGVTEVGLGWYKCTLNSGDLLANSVALLFTGVGVSGGSADQRDFSMILQRTSGQ